MAVRVAYEGRDVDIQIHVDVNGFLTIHAFDDMGRLPALPKMTPEEARQLARQLNRAADRMDRR